MSDSKLSYRHERDSVQFNVSVRMDMNELTRKLNPAQIAAVMQGVAKLVTAEKAAKK